MSKTKILSRLEPITELLSDTKVAFVMLVGSAATDTMGWWSDIDLIVAIPGFIKLSFEDRYQKYLEILTLLDPLELPIDEVEIRIFESLPLHIQFSMISNGIIVYEADPSYRIEETYRILKYYPDHRYWLDTMVKYAGM